MQLNSDAQKIVNTLRAHKQSLIDVGYTPTNAIQKVEYEHAGVDGALVAYALGTADIQEVPLRYRGTTDTPATGLERRTR